MASKPKFCDKPPDCDGERDHEGHCYVWYDGPHYFRIVWLDDDGQPIQQPEP